jgi:hypothetical protein
MAAAPTASKTLYLYGHKSVNSKHLKKNAVFSDTTEPLLDTQPLTGLVTGFYTYRWSTAPALSGALEWSIEVQRLFSL